MFYLKLIKLCFGTLITVLIIDISFAGCGRCEINNDIEIVKNNNAFINSIPSYSSQIEGFVVASCTKCNFSMYGEKKCSIGIKIGSNVYPVENYKHDHSKAHSYDGICNVLRVAYVSGEIKNRKFYSNKLVLIDSPQ